MSSPSSPQQEQEPVDSDMDADDDVIYNNDEHDDEVETENNEKIDQEYSSEFDALKERQDRKMPRIYSYITPQQQSLAGAPRPRPTVTRVINTEQFTISDMHIRNSEDSRIIGTFALLYIKPGGQILPFATVPDLDIPEDKRKDVWYEILHGKGLLCIADYTELLVQGDLILLEPSVKHNFINTGQHPLVIKMLYDYYLDLRDRYTPTAHLTKEAKESAEKLFNVQQKTDEEKSKSEKEQTKGKGKGKENSNTKRVPIIQAEPAVKPDISKAVKPPPSKKKPISEQKFV